MDTSATGIDRLSLVVTDVMRGGQPTDAGWNWLKNNGFTRVVKLNTDGEASDVAAEASGMEVIYQPIPLAEQLIFRPSYANVITAVDAIQPHTFIHCEHGEDRTGLIVGCYRVLKQGWKKSDAWAEMIQHGFHPELLGLTLFWEWAI
jgi:tyrosine-protein phosphatase SIW14